MIDLLTTPIFFLTPWVLIWAILNGLIVAPIVRAFMIQVSPRVPIIAGLTTTIAVIAWNWIIEFNQSTIYLNVDHPILRISWADAFDGVCVFALVSFVLGLFVCKREHAELVAKIAGIAALVTVITDTFLF